MNDDQANDAKPQGTRKSRKSGNYTVPQRATEDAWYQTFADWSTHQQEIALKMCGQVQRIRARITASPERQQQLPGEGQ